MLKHSDILNYQLANYFQLLIFLVLIQFSLKLYDNEKKIMKNLFNLA